ncbi:MAG: GH32 C-terminal domain-containing protein, partial [Armatimonadota bacterium]|nr:GH32 C-terminal domain-containing protein [Armatimonadota bacterium]
MVHEIVQRPDGSLCARPPAAVIESFAQEVALDPQPKLGQWITKGSNFTVNSTAEYSAMLLGALPDQCLVRATVRFTEGTGGCGLLLHTDEGLETGYEVRLEPANGRIVFDPFPPQSDRRFWLERPVRLEPEKAIRLELLVDGTAVVIYVNDQVALSCRTYNHRGGNLGLFVKEGT